MGKTKIREILFERVRERERVIYIYIFCDVVINVKMLIAKGREKKARGANDVV